MALAAPPADLRPAIESRSSGLHSEEGESSTLRATSSDGRSSLERDSFSGPSPDGRHSRSSSNTDGAADGALNTRKQRSRKGGGFLLQNMFHSSLAGNRDRSTRESLDLKGKKKQEVSHPGSGKTRKPYNLDGHAGYSSASPAKTETPRANGPASRAEVENYSPKASSDNMGNALGVLKEAEDSSTEPKEDAPPTPPRPTAAIDPTQIVNMALNLSENRRRNVSGGHLVNSFSGGRRVSSLGSTTGIPTLQGRFQPGAGGSLRQYLQQQRRVSRNMSPGNGKRATNARLQSTSFGYGSYLDATGLPDGGYGHQYHFSAATLARAENARRYIELSIEFRRLLRFLPPLKPDSHAPGNYTFSAASVPGSPGVELSKLPSKVPSRFELGRPYNPLQLIRDRKLRARSRNPLNPGTEAWEDPDEVRDWVDAVNKASKHSHYRGANKVYLPSYPPGSEPTPASALNESHRRSESQSKPKRPRQDWHVSPQELLADAYWLEQDDHKYQIENALGNRLFAAKPDPEPRKPRASYESRHSRNDSIANSAKSLLEENDQQEFREAERRGRKRLLIHQNQDDGSGRFRNILHKARGRSSSSSSDLSMSDDGGGRSVPRITTTFSPEEDNIGPLQRHMDKLLADGTLDTLESSPAVVSPGTPDKWGRRASGPSNQDQKADKAHSPPYVSSQTETTDFVEQPSPSTDLHKHQTSPSIAEPRLSELSPQNSQITKPNGEAVRHFVPSIGMDLSPPPSRHQSPARKSKKAILPFIRSDGNRDSKRHTVSAPTAEDTDDQSSRNASGEAQPRSSAEFTSPIKVKHLFSHRANNSLSSLSSRPGSRGNDAKDGKEHESAMRRFLKGGRIGEIVRHEGAKVGDLISVRKRDSPQRETFERDSDKSIEFLDETDTEGDTNDKPTKARVQPLRRTADGSRKLYEARTKDQKSQYHVELPTFRPANDRQDSSRPSTPGEDHISTQQHVVRGSRPTRFNRLAPPSLDLSKITSRASTAPTLSRTATLSGTPPAESVPDEDSRRGSHGLLRLHHVRSRSRDGRRIKATLDIPGQATGRSATGLPHTALTDVRANRSRSRQAHSDRRHWSITDRQRSRSPRPTTRAAVSNSDVARVRALLLCSGVKAGEIARRAHTPHANAPSRFLVKAARTATVEARIVNRAQEHVVAARLLTASLEKDTAGLGALARHFGDATVSSLRQNIEELRGVVESCVDRSRCLNDDAAAFAGLVSGKGTMDARRVMDSLDRLQRARRRRLRWLRRIGFGLLEWSVLLIMWWVWLMVVVVKSVWSVLGGFGSAVKWVLWLK